MLTCSGSLVLITDYFTSAAVYSSAFLTSSTRSLGNKSAFIKNPAAPKLSASFAILL